MTAGHQPQESPGLCLESGQSIAAASTLATVNDQQLSLLESSARHCVVSLPRLQLRGFYLPPIPNRNSLPAVSAPIARELKSPC